MERDLKSASLRIIDDVARNLFTRYIRAQSEMRVRRGLQDRLAAAETISVQRDPTHVPSAIPQGRIRLQV